MLRPSLRGLGLLADKDPAVADLTEDTFAIILAGVGVRHDKRWRCIFGAVQVGSEGPRGALSMDDDKEVYGWGRGLTHPFRARQLLR